MNRLARIPPSLLLILGVVGLQVVSSGPGGAHAAHTGPPEGLTPDTIRVSGVIVDEAARGVGSARVQILVEGRVLTTTNSERDGSFSARAVLREPGLPSLKVERLGYAPTEVSLDLDPDARLAMRIELVPAPLPLPGLEVFGTDPVCRSPDDSEADAFWSAAVRSHRLDLDTLGIASYTLARTDTLRTLDLPMAPGAASGSGIDATLNPGQRGSAPLLRSSWERRVERQGYAFPVRRTNRDGSYDSWSYAPLEADFAQHFLSEPFNRWHHFYSLERTIGGGHDLYFCPVEERRPGLRGRLRFSADTLLIRAEWSFVTPEPDEQAGGWSSFPSASEFDEVRLLPNESLTWRMLPDGRVQRRAQWYEGWILAPGDSVPFLPAR